MPSSQPTPSVPLFPAAGPLAGPQGAALLERGEVAHYHAAPFSLPTGDDLDFLLQQQIASFGHKHITCHLADQRLVGLLRQGERDQAARLVEILLRFSETVTTWVRTVLPAYREGLRAEVVHFHPAQEATRRLRTIARNDLLHIDASPNRPTRGDRILRVFANINPTEPRVWITSDPFAVLLQRYGREVGLPGEVTPSVFDRVKEGLRRLMTGETEPTSPYDSFMHRFHDYLMRNDAFQTQCAKTVWHFLPGSVWVLMGDACSHAVLRGQYALEQSFRVSHTSLVVPEESPLSLLERMCAVSGPLRSAA